MLQGKWVSNIDIHGKNLNVLAGQPLPEAWQNAAKMSYLKNQYGEDSFGLVNSSVAVGEVVTGGSIQSQIGELKAEMAEIKLMLAQALGKKPDHLKKEASKNVDTKKK